MFSVWCQIFQNLSDFTLFQFFLDIMLDFFPGKRQRKTSASVKCTLLSDQKKSVGWTFFAVILALGFISGNLKLPTSS